MYYTQSILLETGFQILDANLDTPNAGAREQLWPKAASGIKPEAKGQRVKWLRRDRTLPLQTPTESPTGASAARRGPVPNEFIRKSAMTSLAFARTPGTAGTST